jgi:hypothetical protein
MTPQGGALQVIRFKAEHFYRQYLELLLMAANGLYSIEDAAAKIPSLHDADRQKFNSSKIRMALNAAMQSTEANVK